MAQTRSAAKALRLVLSWVAVLGGYQPTPFEEMDGVYDRNDGKKEQSKPYDFKPIVITPDPTANYTKDDIDYFEQKAEYDQYLNDNPDVRITEKQKGLLERLIKERVVDTSEIDNQISQLVYLTKQEASNRISEFLR